jgi:hypothetical protein
MVRRRTRTRKKPARGATKGHANAWVLAILAGLVVVNLYVFVWDKKTSIAAVQERAFNPPTMQVGDRPLENLDPMGSGSAATAPSNEGAPRATAAVPDRAGQITGKVGKSDTLGKLLKRNGLTGKDTDEVIRAVTRVYNVQLIRAGEAFVIERDPDGRVRGFELEIGRTTRLRAVRDTSGALVGQVEATAPHRMPSAE